MDKGDDKVSTPAAPPRRAAVRAASYDAEALTPLDQPKRAADAPPPSSPVHDRGLDPDAGVVAEHNTPLSASIRRAPIHDLLDVSKLKHLCAAARAGGAEGAERGGTGGGDKPAGYARAPFMEPMPPKK